MAKTVGRFSYRIRAPKKSTKPFTPTKAVVHIIPAYYSRDEDGCPLLSPELMSEEEIDLCVQAYKEDLDHVGRLAKRALQRANQRTYEWLKTENAARNALKVSKGRCAS